MFRLGHTGRSLLLSIAIIVVGTFFYASALTQEPNRQLQTRASTSPALSSRDACGYQGNSDIYGLGIRIGIYLQWFATILATAFVPEEMLGTTIANTVFLIAFTVATLVLSSSVPEDGTPTADMVIMLSIYAVSVYSLYSLSWIGRHFGPSCTVQLGVSDSSAMGECVKAVVSNCMATISIWFWFRGIDNFAPTPCGTSTFIFAKLDVYGRAVRTVYRVLSCIWLFVCLWYTSVPIIALLVVPAATSYLLWRKKTLRDVIRFYRRFVIPWVLDSVSAYTEYARRNRQRSELQVRVFRGLLAAADVVIFALAIANIELTIKWNSISDVYDIRSTGQIIPLVIGVSTMLNLLWSAAFARLKRWIGPEDKQVDHDQDMRNLLWPTYDMVRPVRQSDDPVGRDREQESWMQSFKGPLKRRHSLDSIHIPGFKDDLSLKATSDGSRVKVVWVATYKKGASNCDCDCRPNRPPKRRLGFIPAIRQFLADD